MTTTEQQMDNPRLPAFVRPRHAPAAALARTRVGLVGAGAIGGRIGRELAPFHLQALDVVDPKQTKAESVYTHGIGPDHVGREKAVLTAQAVRALSPATAVRGLVAGIADVEPALVAAWDFAFLATDNLAAEVDAGQLCLRYGVPLVHASVNGDTLVAQIRFFGNQDDDVPCPACLFSAQEWDLLNRSVQFSCDGASAPANELPTRSVGSLCAMAASLAVHAFLRHVVGLGPDRRDHLVEYAGYTDRTRVSTLHRNPACPCDHTRYQRVWVDGHAGRISARDLAGLVGAEAAETFAASQFGVEGQRWAARAQCAACGRRWPLKRFVHPRALGAVRCPRCGDGAAPCHVFTQSAASGRQLAALAGVALDGLCNTAPTAFTVRRPDGQAFLLRHPREDS